MNHLLDLLKTLSIGSDYSPESLEQQSRNLAANQKRIDKYAAEIRKREVRDIAMNHMSEN